MLERGVEEGMAYRRSMSRKYGLESGAKYNGKRAAEAGMLCS